MSPHVVLGVLTSLIGAVYGKEDQAADDIRKIDHARRSGNGFLASALIDSVNSEHAKRKKKRGTWDIEMDLLKTSTAAIDEHMDNLESQLTRLPNDIGSKTWVVLERQNPARMLKVFKNGIFDHAYAAQDGLHSLAQKSKAIENALAIDATKVFERVQRQLEFKDPDKDGNKKMAHRIRSVLTGNPTMETDEVWVGKDLDTMNGPHRKGNYAPDNWPGEGGCDEQCGKDICVPACVPDFCKESCMLHPEIVGDWKTSRGVFAHIKEDGKVHWEVGNAELRRGAFKDDRLQDHIIKDPEGFEKSLIFLWRTNKGPYKDRPLMYHGHCNTECDKITWLEDDDVWERVDHGGREAIAKKKLAQARKEDLQEQQERLQQQHQQEEEQDDQPNGSQQSKEEQPANLLINQPTN
eukprot:gnl/MRDRNA2_/MRDRNA2_126126_c0_seq1.p1 gnl/MRDRNA2_/MRDRNA2_126126_c0~~gnl/MRDRNA2_/MRDRNA2_126126_c0_seq1.p1  ORF type:complete len:408 (+),score=95.51 gnl/MRDRNA2_/MRDRNA2_126126_c0_seq1:56-1279(+)